MAKGVFGFGNPPAFQENDGMKHMAPFGVRVDGELAAASVELFFEQASGSGDFAFRATVPILV